MIPVAGFRNRTVAVFGLARTGLTAARALIAGGAKVALWDESADTRARAAAEGLPLADLAVADFNAFDSLLLSPRRAPHTSRASLDRGQGEGRGRGDRRRTRSCSHAP